MPMQITINNSLLVFIILYSVVVFANCNESNKKGTTLRKGQGEGTEVNPCDQIEFFSTDLSSDFYLLKLNKKTEATITLSQYAYSLVYNVDQKITMNKEGIGDDGNSIWVYYNVTNPIETESFKLELKLGDSSPFTCPTELKYKRLILENAVTISNCNTEKTICWTGNDEIIVTGLTSGKLVIGKVNSDKITISFQEQNSLSLTIPDASEGTYYFFVYDDTAAAELKYIKKELQYYKKPTITLIQSFMILHENASKVIFNSDKEITQAYIGENLVPVTKDGDKYYFSIDISTTTGDYVYQLEYHRRFNMPSLLIVTKTDALEYSLCNLNSIDFSFTLHLRLIDLITKVSLVFENNEENFTKNEDKSYTIAPKSRKGKYMIHLYADAVVIFSTEVTFTSYTLNKNAFYLTSRVLFTDAECNLEPIEIEMSNSPSNKYNLACNYREKTIICSLGQFPENPFGTYNLYITGTKRTEAIELQSINGIEFAVNEDIQTAPTLSKITISIQNNPGLNFEEIVISSIAIKSNKENEPLYELTSIAEEGKKFTVSDDKTQLVWMKALEAGEVVKITTLFITDKKDSKSLDVSIGEPTFRLVNTWGMFPKNIEQTIFIVNIKVDFTEVSIATMYMSKIYFGEIPMANCAQKAAIIECSKEITPIPTTATSYEIKVQISDEWKTPAQNYDLFLYFLSDTCLALEQDNSEGITTLAINQGNEVKYKFQAKLYKNDVFISSNVNGEFTVSSGVYDKLEVERILITDETIKSTIETIVEVYALTSKVIAKVEEIYSPSQQSLLIHFTTPIIPPDIIQAKLTSGDKQIEYNTCTPQDLEEGETQIKKVLCSKTNIDISFVSLSLDLSWKNKCQAKDYTYPTKIEVKKNLIFTVFPYVVMLLKEPKDNIKLTFMSELIEKPKIALIDEQNNKITLINEDYDFSPDNQLSLIIDASRVNTNTVGKYTIELSYTEGEIFDSTSLFIVKNTNIKFAYENKAVTKGSLFQGLVITFADKDDIQLIGKISLIKDGAAITETITFTHIEGENTIELVHAANAELKFEFEGTYLLKFHYKEQLIEYIPVNFEIYVYDGTIKISPLSKKVFIYEDKVIPIEFTKDLSEIKIINKIQDNGLVPKVYFNIKPNGEGNKQLFVLEFQEMTTNFNRYEGIDFIDSEGKKLPFAIEGSYIIMNEEGLPHANSYNSIVINANGEFIVEFNNPLFGEYLEYIKITGENIIENSCDIRIIEEEPKNKLNVTCQYAKETSRYSMRISFLKYQLSNENFNVLKCEKELYWDGALCKSCSESFKILEKGEYLCKLCSELNPDLPYFELNSENATNSCVAECSELKVISEAICHDECPNKPSDGVDASRQCVKIEIIEIDQKIYAFTQQQFKIKLNSRDIYEAIKSFQLKKVDDETIIIALNNDCTISETNKNEYNCITDAFNSAIGGKYKLYWINAENANDEKGFNITIFSNRLADFTPKKVKIGTNPVDVVLTYSNAFDKTKYKLALKYKGNDQMTSIDVSEYTAVDENIGSQLILTFNTSFEYEGPFAFVTTGPDDYLDEHPVYLVTYKKVLALVKTVEIIEVNKEVVEMINIEIQEDISLNLIKAIKLHVPNNADGISIENYSIVARMLSLNYPISFNIIGDYIVVIEDIVNDTPPKYIIRTTPLAVTLGSSVFYYKDDTSYIEITFDNPLETTISSVKLKASEFNLSLEKIAENDNNVYKAKLAQVPVNPGWNKYEGLEFYNKRKDEEAFIAFEATKSLIIVNPDTIPHIPKSENMNIYIPIGANEFAIEFKEKVYIEYFENEPKINAKDELCQVSYIEGINNSINVHQCKFELNDGVEFTLISFDQELIFTIKNSCTPPTVMNSLNQCVLCKEKDPLKSFYYKNACYNDCPIDTIIEGEQCYDTCSEIPGKENLPYLKDGSCVATCEEMFTYEEGKKCYATCPVPLYTDESTKKCHDKCPEGLLVDETTKKCHSNCPEPLYTDDIEGKCFAKCPNASYTDEEDKKCYKKCPAPLFEYDKIKQCYKECPEGLLKHDQAKKCYETCPSPLYAFTEGKECLNKCPDNFNPTLDYICQNRDSCSIVDKNGICLENCPVNTEYNSTSKLCVYSLPTFNDESCKSTCQNGECVMTNGRTRCICADTHYDLTCSTPKNTVNEFQTNVAQIIFKTSLADFDPENLEILNNVLLLTEVIAQDKNTINFIRFENEVSKIIKSTETLFDKKIENENSIIPFIDLALKISLNNIVNWRVYARLLQALQPSASEKIESLKADIKRIIDLTSSYFKEVVKSKLNTNTKDILIYIDQIGLFNIIAWTNDDESYRKYLTAVNNTNATRIDATDLIDHLNISSYSTINLELSADVLAETPIIAIQSSGSIIALIDNSNKQEITKALPSLNPKLNMFMLSKYETSDFNYFIERDINIYDANDPAFTKSCYSNKKLDLDLTSNYRKFKVYSNRTIIPSPGCDYVGFNVTTNKVILQCPLTTISGASYSILSFNLTQSDNNDDNKNLLIFCVGKLDFADTIVNNFAFWTFLVVLIVGIITFITLAIVDNTEVLKHRINKWVIRDELIAPNAIQNQSSSHIQIVKNVDDIRVYTKNTTKDVNAPNEYDLNFLTLHPLSTIFCESIVCPLTSKIALFMFNILNLFGFNAVLYSETMIENKITDEMRDNFAYPMKSEFSKIIISICISMILCIIMRAIAIVTIRQKEELSRQLLEAATEEEKYKISVSFWRKGFTRRLVCYILMLGLTAFLFYYSIMFCGMYVNTQYGWFYSGIWALLLNWIVFAPVSIIIISAIDAADCASECVYYTKQLFWF